MHPDVVGAELLVTKQVYVGIKKAPSGRFYISPHPYAVHEDPRAELIAELPCGTKLPISSMEGKYAPSRGGPALTCHPLAKVKLTDGRAVSVITDIYWFSPKHSGPVERADLHKAACTDVAETFEPSAPQTLLVGQSGEVSAFHEVGRWHTDVSKKVEWQVLQDPSSPTVSLTADGKLTTLRLGTARLAARFKSPSGKLFEKVFPFDSSKEIGFLSSFGLDLDENGRIKIIWESHEQGLGFLVVGAERRGSGIPEKLMFLGEGYQAADEISQQMIEGPPARFDFASPRKRERIYLQHAKHGGIRVEFAFGDFAAGVYQRGYRAWLYDFSFTDPEKAGVVPEFAEPTNPHALVHRIFQVDAPDAEESVRLLGALGEGALPALPALISGCAAGQGRNFNPCSSIVKQLGEAAVKPLLQIVRSGSSRERYHAVMLLGQANLHQAVPELSSLSHTFYEHKDGRDNMYYTLHQLTLGWNARATERERADVATSLRPLLAHSETRVQIQGILDVLDGKNKRRKQAPLQR